MIQTLYDCAKLGNISLSDSQISSFKQYADLLLEWNEKMNLTAIVEPTEIATKHFYDSLNGADFILPGASLIDVGTGAGFPGVPLKIARPDINLTLLDSLNKRLNFLNEVISSLKLSDVKTVHARAEEGAKAKSPYREKYDVCVSRAVSALNVLSEYCIPYLKVGGVFLAYKGPDVKDEVDSAKNAIATLGGEISEIYEYTIPTTDIKHSLVVIKKIKPTDNIYPRQNGKINKKPL